MEVVRDPRFQVGQRIPGTNWVIRGILGTGGMGIVLDAAKDPGIQAAIKVLLPRFAGSKEFVARFRREVRVLAELKHPNIVHVYDCDTLLDGTPYMIMERLEGLTLHAAARELLAAEKHFTARDVWDVARQVCAGLYRAHTHARPVVHRDLKPDNIYLHQLAYGGETVVKLIDFGVAERMDVHRIAPSDYIVGTLRYMAPEAFRGERVGPRSDLYSLALVLYEMLTFRLPWELDGRSVTEVEEAHVHGPVPPPSTFAAWIPKSVDECLLRALAKAPEDRQEDANQLQRELVELQWVHDGPSDTQVDANTTVPNLGTLARIGSRRGTSSAPPSSPFDTTPVAAPSFEGIAGEDPPAAADPEVTRREAVMAVPPEALQDSSAPPEPEPFAAYATSGTLGRAPALPEPTASEEELLEPPKSADAVGAESSEPVVVSGAVTKRAPERPKAWRRGVLATAIAAGAAMVLAWGLSLRWHASLPSAARAHPTGAVLPAEVLRGMEVPASTTSAPAALDAAPEPAARQEKGAASAMAVESRDAAMPSLGVVPLPTATEVRAAEEARSAAAADGAGSAPPPTRTASGSPGPPTGSSASRSKRAASKPRPAASRDDGFELLSVPK